MTVNSIYFVLGLNKTNLRFLQILLFVNPKRTKNNTKKIIKILKNNRKVILVLLGLSVILSSFLTI